MWQYRVRERVYVHAISGVSVAIEEFSRRPTPEMLDAYCAQHGLESAEQRKPKSTKPGCVNCGAPKQARLCSYCKTGA